jgi:hypothetical protein
MRMTLLQLKDDNGGLFWSRQWIVQQIPYLALYFDSQCADFALVIGS